MGSEMCIRDRIKIRAIFTWAFEVAHARKQCIARLLAAKPVQGAVGKNPLEQHGQFARRFVPVMLGQLEHAVLHDVERRFLVANVVDRALECALFYAFEEIGEFLFGCQDGSAREEIGADICSFATQRRRKTADYRTRRSFFRLRSVL